jgi:hypothetical protein
MRLKLKPAAALTLILMLAFPRLALAATYKDVPASHFAYYAVDWVSNPANGSFMVGDAANNFNPGRTLDKFEAAKILAVAAGFKYAASAISPAEQELYDRSYAEWKTLIDAQAAQYGKWSRTADREIAYLLYKNILTAADVSTFISRVGGAEQINLMSRQEAIVFMIRLDGRQMDAEGIVLPYHTPYKDDAQIRADFKKYIYYAKEAGIAGGSDGYISPTRSFTRAEMAQMFYNMFANRAQVTATPAPNGDSNTTINGIVDYVFAQDGVSYVYIKIGAQVDAYRLAQNAVIMVDNVPRTANDLVKGMNVSAVVRFSSSAVEILSIVATSQIVPTPMPTPIPTAAPILNIPTAELGALTTPEPVTLQEDEGYIVAVSSIPTEAVTIKTQRVKLTGEIITEDKTFTLSPTCVITRGAGRVYFSDVRVNDISSFKYSGTVLHSLTLQEKDRVVRGTLVEKKFIEASDTPVLVIEDAIKVKHELRVTASTVIERGTLRNLPWTELRVGDDIEAQCEYDRLLNVYATGTRGNVSGKVSSIFISAASQELTLLRADGTSAVYLIPAGVYDIYSLRVGMDLTLYLDSWEVYDIAQ